VLSPRRSPRCRPSARSHLRAVPLLLQAPALRRDSMTTACLTCHLQKLRHAQGRPAPARSGHAGTMRASSSAIIARRRRSTSWEELTAMAKSPPPPPGRPLCLLCYERDPAHCHRQRPRGRCCNNGSGSGSRTCSAGVAGGVRPIIRARAYQLQRHRHRRSLFGAISELVCTANHRWLVLSSGQRFGPHCATKPESPGQYR